MPANLKYSLLFGALSGLLLQVPAYSTVDWNWPMNQIPSNPKEIDRAMTAYQEGDIDTAIAALQGVKGAQNQDCRVRHILVDIYRDQKRFPEAKRELADLAEVERRFIQTNSAKPGWMNPDQLKMDQADISNQEGQFAESMQIYKELSAAKPSWFDPKFMIGRVYEAMGEQETARNHYKQMLDSGMALTASDKASIMSQMNYVDQQLAAKNASANVSAGQAGQDQQPGGGPPAGGAGNLPPPRPPLGGFGSSSFSGGGGIGRTGGGASTPVRTIGTGPLQEASDDIAHKKYDEAIARLKPVVQKSPNNAQAHYILAIAYVSKGMYAEAKGEYEATLKYATDMKLQKLASAGLLKIQNKN